MLEGKPLPTIWDVPDGLWERIEPVILELDPPQIQGAQTGGPAEDAGRHYLSDAKRLPVEPLAPGVGRR